MEKRATQILEEEHHLMQKVFGSMAALADRLYEGNLPGGEVLVELVDFMRIFVEGCHHEKEDNHLFPLLARKGVPVAGCPIGVLTHEHETSRRLTADLGAAVDAFLKNPQPMSQFLITTLRGIVELYPNHIWKENYLLFPMTDKLLDEEEQRQLLESFNSVECRFSVDVRSRFERLVESVAEKAGNA
jgi:hemerythrin-like domain-containing protein